MTTRTLIPFSQAARLIWRGTSFVCVLLPLLFAAGARAAAGTPEDCAGDHPILIRQTTRLNPACVYRTTLRIEAGNLELDCRNALILPGTRGQGIQVGGNVRGVSGVAIRHCRIRGGGNGVFIGLNEADNVKVARHDRETLYRITPHDITLDNVHVEDSRGVGIYVDDYASRVKILNSRVEGAGSSGIYLEHSTREIEVRDSLLRGNGFGSFPVYRFGEARREGLSIDSSAYNLVSGNRFEGNAAGGIFLYKNCQEHIHTKPYSVPRWQGSDHNSILDNTFLNEKVGVWIASRQSRDLSSWDCGDKPYLGDSHYPDFARHNRVAGNRFEGGGTGVRVEDDDNLLEDNTFVDVANPIELGADLRRQVTGKPLTGVVIRGNRTRPGKE